MTSREEWAWVLVLSGLVWAGISLPVGHNLASTVFTTAHYKVFGAWMLDSYVFVWEGRISSSVFPFQSCFKGMYENTGGETTATKSGRSASCCPRSRWMNVIYMSDYTTFHETMWLLICIFFVVIVCNHQPNQLCLMKKLMKETSLTWKHDNAQK